MERWVKLDLTGIMASEDNVWAENPTKVVFQCYLLSGVKELKDVIK